MGFIQLFDTTIEVRYSNNSPGENPESDIKYATYQSLSLSLCIENLIGFRWRQ